MRAVALGMAAATAAIQSPSNVPLGLSLHKLTASASGLLNGQTSVHSLFKNPTATLARCRQLEWPVQRHCRMA
eukprot:scaffold148540_cov19-Tisochrysis_lutea.AAC.1